MNIYVIFKKHAVTHLHFFIHVVLLNVTLQLGQSALQSSLLLQLPHFHFSLFCRISAESISNILRETKSCWGFINKSMLSIAGCPHNQGKQTRVYIFRIHLHLTFFLKREICSLKHVCARKAIERRKMTINCRLVLINMRGGDFLLSAMKS